MAEVRVSQVIRASREQVFDVFTDFDRAVEIIPDIQRIEMLTAGPLAVGTTFRETRAMFGRQGMQDMQVTDLDRPNYYVLTTKAQGMLCTVTFSFAEQDGETLVTVNFHARPFSFLGKMLTPLSGLMNEMIRKALESDLRHFKQAIES